MSLPGLQPMLQVTGLTRHFGGIRAVDNVNMSVETGQIHAIIGPNGAGKTTLIAQLSGELKPSSGTIRFQQRDITALDSAQRARLGLARSFQITSVIMPMTLLDNVMLAVQGARGHSFRFWEPVTRDQSMRDAAMDTLAGVNLADRADTVASEVSHGEHRQLEIAMALAMQPKLLLLDEPMAGMGPEESARMVTILDSLKNEKTILLIEHDMDAVFALADTISVLVNGQMIATDNAANIRHNTEVQRAYLGEADQ